MLIPSILAGRTIPPFDTAERATLERSIVEVRSVRARTVLSRKGEGLDFGAILLKGFLSRHVDDRQGHRQFLALQVPGDLIDFHAVPMRLLDHEVAALSDVQIALIPQAAIAAMIQADGALARKIGFATLLDAALYRGWIFRLGRLAASGRVCHFFAETGARLFAVGLGTPERFLLPITQADLGEACSLTSVHTSRVLKTLRSSGICTFRDGEVRIHNCAALVRMAQFDCTYLYLDDEIRLAFDLASEVARPQMDLTPVKSGQRMIRRDLSEAQDK